MKSGSRCVCVCTRVYVCVRETTDEIWGQVCMCMYACVCVCVCVYVCVLFCQRP